MDFIHVKEEIIDNNEFETHPVTNTGDWGGLPVGGNVKKKIELDEELEMEEWEEMDLEEIEPPEDWTGPLDDLESDDLSY